MELGSSQQAVWALLGASALALLASGLLLLPAWLRRRCCLLYLKLHYCFTTSLALGLMLYCLMSNVRISYYEISSLFLCTVVQFIVCYYKGTQRFFRHSIASGVILWCQ